MDKRNKNIILLFSLLLGLSIIIGTIIISKYKLGFSESNNWQYIAKDELPKLTFNYIIFIISGSLIINISLLFLIKINLLKEHKKKILFLMQIISFTIILSIILVYLINNYILI